MELYGCMLLSNNNDGTWEILNDDLVFFANGWQEAVDFVCDVLDPIMPEEIKGKEWIVNCATLKARLKCDYAKCVVCQIDMRIIDLKEPVRVAFGIEQQLFTKCEMV